MTTPHRKPFEKPIVTKNSTKTAPRKCLILSAKKLCMSDVIKATANAAWDEKEASISINTLSIHLPLTVRHNDPGKEPIPLKLPEWRDLPTCFTASMYQLALATLEQQTGKMLVPFVFCCSQELTDKAKQEKNEAEYISKRIRDALQKAFNFVPEYWFALEMAGIKGFPHVQGSILLSVSEISRFKKVLHKINGKVTSHFKNYALRTRENRRSELIQERGQLYTDINWALYNTKESGRIAFQYTGHNRNIAVRQDVTKLAKQLYEELRAANLAKLNPQQQISESHAVTEFDEHGSFDNNANAFDVTEHSVSANESLSCKVADKKRQSGFVNSMFLVSTLSLVLLTLDKGASLFKAFINEYSQPCHAKRKRCWRNSISKHYVGKPYYHQECNHHVFA